MSVAALATLVTIATVAGPALFGYFGLFKSVFHRPVQFAAPHKPVAAAGQASCSDQTPLQAGKGKKKKGKRKPQKARLADQQVNNDSNSTKPVETLTQSQQRVLAKAKDYMEGFSTQNCDGCHSSPAKSPCVNTKGAATTIDMAGKGKKTKKGKRKPQEARLADQQANTGSAGAEPVKTPAESLQRVSSEVAEPDTPSPRTTRQASCSFSSESDSDTTYGWEKVARKGRSCKKTNPQQHCQPAAHQAKHNSGYLVQKQATVSASARTQKQISNEANKTKCNIITNKTAITSSSAKSVTPLVGQRGPIRHFWDRKRSRNGSLPAGYQALKTAHPELCSFRTTRGDGNCAYRAIMSGLVENAFHRPTARSYLFNHLQALHSSMPSWTLMHESADNQGCRAEEGFHVLLALVSNAEKRSLQQLLNVCNNQRASNSMVLFLRALTAAAVLGLPQEDQANLCIHMDSNEIAAGFLSQGIQHVCQELILPLPPQDTREPLFQWREADQLHLSALAQILGVRMEIFSVLGKNFSHTRYQELRTNAGAIRLVLHSGHYDLIY